MIKKAVSPKYSTMMLPPEISVGRIPREFYDSARIKATVRLGIQSERWVSRQTILGALNKVSGFSLANLNAIYQRTEMSKTWYLELKSREAADFLCALKVLDHSSFKASICPIEAQTVRVRVHWLPNYIRDSYVKVFLSAYCQPLTIRPLHNEDDGVYTYNGVREVQCIMSEEQKSKIPHVVRFESGESMLITIQGRQPYCLKCRQIGHLRKDCTERKPPSGVGPSAHKSKDSAPKDSTDGAAAPPSTDSSEPRPEAPQTKESNAKGAKRTHEENQSEGSWAEVAGKKTARPSNHDSDSIPVNNYYQTFTDEDMLHEFNENPATPEYHIVDGEDTGGRELK